MADQPIPTDSLEFDPTPDADEEAALDADAPDESDAPETTDAPGVGEE